MFFAEREPPSDDEDDENVEEELDDSVKDGDYVQDQETDQESDTSDDDDEMRTNKKPYSGKEYIAVRRFRLVNKIQRPKRAILFLMKYFNSILF
jgi:hypothetical protein